MEPMKTVTMAGTTYEITDAQARQELDQIADGAEIIGTVRSLTGLQDGRATSANLPVKGTNTLQYLLATASMTVGKPPIGDSKILHMEWDNTGGYSCQLAIKSNSNMNAANAIAVRGMSSGTWGPWNTLLDLLYPVGSVYISNTNANPGSVLGGTWSLIHKRYAYAIVNDAVTWNATNTSSQASAFILNGETITFRLNFQNAVDLADTTIEIGTINLAKIGLTGKYSQQFLYTNDGGGGVAIVIISDTGAISSIEAIGKSTGTLPAGQNGQITGTLMFAQGAMLDNFCDEFHFQRTA